MTSAKLKYSGNVANDFKHRHDLAKNDLCKLAKKLGSKLLCNASRSALLQAVRRLGAKQGLKAESVGRPPKRSAKKSKSVKSRKAKKSKSAKKSSSKKRKVKSAKKSKSVKSRKGKSAKKSSSKKRKVKSVKKSSGSAKLVEQAEFVLQNAGNNLNSVNRNKALGLANKLKVSRSKKARLLGQKLQNMVATDNMPSLNSRMFRSPMRSLKSRSVRPPMKHRVATPRRSPPRSASRFNHSPFPNIPSGRRGFGVPNFSGLD